MKLVFIYGPPAVGKLTVATELARITSYAVFDNHLSLDCVLPVFGFGTKSLDKLVTRIRLLVIEEAAREDVDVIFTFVYAHPNDLPYVEHVRTTVERHGGTVCFVQLKCSQDAQEERVLHPDRASRRKARSVDLVRELNERHDLRTSIPGTKTLTLDTTHLPPADVAEAIVDHLSLRPRDR